jgi:hypothetical protein
VDKGVLQNNFEGGLQMRIKPVDPHHSSSSEMKQKPADSSEPQKGKGISETSDSVEQYKGENLEYLKAIGADSLLNEAELQQAAEDEKKGKSLIDLMATGQLLGASTEAMQKAKDKYLNDATPGGLEKVKFDLLTDSQKIPAEDAKSAGLSAKDLLNLKANLELLGEEDSDGILQNPQIYQRIKQNGMDSVLADVAIKNLGLSEAAKGLSLKKILDGAAAAQKNGKDASKAEYWDRLRKGHGASASGKAHGKGKPEHTPGEQGGRAPAKPADNRERGKFIEEPIHHAKVGGPHHRGDSALNPLARKKEDGSKQTTTPPQQQHHNSSKNSTTRSSSQTDRNWQRDTEPANRQHQPKESTHTGGTPKGTPSGNSTQGSDSTNTPTQGTNPTGGAANDYSGAPGADQQTGIGVSAASGQDAHAGAVNTVTGVHHGVDGTTTFYWSRSGGNDGKDGHYRTVYDGHGGWMSFNEDTEDLAGQGTGDPPDDSIVGQSSQTYNPETEDMIFGTSEDGDGTTTDSTDDDDEDSTTVPEDTSVEGKPIDPLVGGSSEDGVLHPWEIGTHVSRTDQLIHTTGSSSGARPAVPYKGKPNDGVTDPGREMQSKRVGGSKKFLRSDGYTDPSPGDSGGHKPVTAEDQPKRPSHAKTGGQHQSGHLSSHRRRRT